LNAAHVRHVCIEDFSRLNFEYVLLSKRKLKYFVDEKIVDSWDDPRFPTVQGILRRGMTVEALREFMLAQGASKNLNLMTMDKLWAINKKIIDPIIPRYTAISDQRVPFVLSNGPEKTVYQSVLRHKKNPSLGSKTVTYTSRILLELEDAKVMKENEEVTLMDWGNAIVRKIHRDDEGKVVKLEGELHLEGDFKTTELKLTWLSDTDELIPVVLRSYGYLITKKKLAETDEFTKFINKESLKTSNGVVGDSSLRLLNKGERIQLERNGYYICDSPFVYPAKPLVLILIPDGKSDNQAEDSSKDNLQTPAADDLQSKGKENGKGKGNPAKSK